MFLSFHHLFCCFFKSKADLTSPPLSILHQIKKRGRAHRCFWVLKGRCCRPSPGNRKRESRAGPGAFILKGGAGGLPVSLPPNTYTRRHLFFFFSLHTRKSHTFLQKKNVIASPDDPPENVHDARPLPPPPPLHWMRVRVREGAPDNAQNRDRMGWFLFGLYWSFHPPRSWF